MNKDRDILGQIMRVQNEIAIRHVGTIEDPYFFRFSVDKGAITSRACCVAPEQYIVEPQGLFQSMTFSLCSQPFVSKNENTRAALLGSKAGIPDTISNFPSRKVVDAGLYPMFADDSALLLGSDTILHLHVDGEDKILQTMRDMEAPVYPGYWSCAGGMVTESPSMTAIKELNEETAIIVGGEAEPTYKLLLLALDGITGVSKEQKEREIPHIRNIIANRYQDFDAGKEIEIVRVALEPRVVTGWKPIRILSSVDQKIVDQTTAHLTLFPARSISMLLRPVNLPREVKSIPVLGDLRHGKNCFFADLEFLREIEPFSAREVAYLEKAGKYFDSVTTYLAASGYTKGQTPPDGLYVRGNHTRYKTASQQPNF